MQSKLSSGTDQSIADGEYNYYPGAYHSFDRIGLPVKVIPGNGKHVGFNQHAFQESIKRTKMFLDSKLQ